MTALGPDSKCEAQVPIIYADLVNKGWEGRGGAVVVAAAVVDLLLTI